MSSGWGGSARAACGQAATGGATGVCRGRSSTGPAPPPRHTRMRAARAHHTRAPPRHLNALVLPKSSNCTSTCGCHALRASMNSATKASYSDPVARGRLSPWYLRHSGAAGWARPSGRCSPGQQPRASCATLWQVRRPCARGRAAATHWGSSSSRLLLVPTSRHTGRHRLGSTPGGHGSTEQGPASWGARQGRGRCGGAIGTAHTRLGCQPRHSCQGPRPNRNGARARRARAAAPLPPTHPPCPPCPRAPAATEYSVILPSLMPMPAWERAAQRGQGSVGAAAATAAASSGAHLLLCAALI